MPFEWRDCILTMAVGQVVTTQTGLHLWSYTATSTKVTKEESREDAVRKHGLKVVSVEVWSLWIHSPMRSAIVWREIPQWIPSVVLSCEFSFRHWSDHHNGYTICSGCRLLTADPRQAVQQACPETLDEDAIDPHFCIFFSSEDISADLQHFACQDVWCEDQRLVKNGSLRVRLLAQLIYMRFCFDFTLIQWWLIRSFLADHCHYAQWIRQIFFWNSGLPGQHGRVGGGRFQWCRVVETWIGGGKRNSYRNRKTLRVWKAFLCIFPTTFFLFMLTMLIFNLRYMGVAQIRAPQWLRIAEGFKTQGGPNSSCRVKGSFHLCCQEGFLPMLEEYEVSTEDAQALCAKVLEATRQFSGWKVFYPMINVI